MFTILPLQPFPSLYKDQSTITVSLSPSKHFNLTITAYNDYENTSTTVVISKSILEKTFCTFEHVHTSFPGKYILCCWCLFQYLISHGTGVSLQHWLIGQRVFGVSNRHRHRCNILQSGLEIIGHTSQYIFMPPSNGPLSTGVYSVVVYAIERDGIVSLVPALVGEIMTVLGPSAMYVPSSTVYVISSSSILTTDQGTIVNISIYSIEGSMCSYEQNVSFYFFNTINSTASHEQFAWLNKTFLNKYNQI